MEKFCPVKSSNDPKSIDPSLCPVKGQKTDRYKNPNQVYKIRLVYYIYISIYLYSYNDIYIYIYIYFFYSIMFTVKR